MSDYLDGIASTSQKPLPPCQHSPPPKHREECVLCGNLTSKMMGDENKGHSLSAFIRSTQSPEVDFLKLALGAFKMIRAAAST